MSKAAVENRRKYFGILLDLWRLWTTRPNRRRKWQVLSTFGGTNFALRGVKESELTEKLAGFGTIVYVDHAAGFVFIDDGKRPGHANAKPTP